MKTFDLSEVSVRDLNQMLHDQSVECVEREFEVLNPQRAAPISPAVSTRTCRWISRGMPVTSAPA